jgi:hypothetical protein
MGNDEKILCVPSRDPRMEHLRDIRHVPEFERLEIQHFFEVYKALEPGKSVQAEAWANRAAAEVEVEECRKRLADHEAADHLPVSRRSILACPKSRSPGSIAAKARPDRDTRHRHGQMAGYGHAVA